MVGREGGRKGGERDLEKRVKEILHLVSINYSKPLLKCKRFVVVILHCKKVAVEVLKH